MPWQWIESKWKNLIHKNNYNYNNIKTVQGTRSSPLMSPEHTNINLKLIASTHKLHRCTYTTLMAPQQTQFTHAQKDESSTIITMYLWNRKSNNRTHTANMSIITISHIWSDGISIHQRCKGRSMNLWKEWGTSNFQIFLHNCQFHQRQWELVEHLMCFYYIAFWLNFPPQWSSNPRPFEFEVQRATDCTIWHLTSCSMLAYPRTRRRWALIKFYIILKTSLLRNQDLFFERYSYLILLYLVWRGLFKPPSLWQQILVLIRTLYSMLA